MTTDFQDGRQALGARLRELRTKSGLTGRVLAERLGWPQSKVSKLENGRQTATVEDLQVWAESTGQPGAAEELKARLHGLESHTRSWKRQLAAGHRPVQDTLNAGWSRSSVFQAWEGAMVVGVLQTPDYARCIFTRYADLHCSVRDTQEAVRARMRRQELLYAPGKRFHILQGEAALHARVCPLDVLAAQLDRLSSALGLGTLSLGIIPFGAQLRIPPANAFWIHDERLVIVEDWHAELWLDDADNVALYLRVWSALRDSAVYGADAHRLIMRAKHALNIT